MQIRYTSTPGDVSALLRHNFQRSPRLWGLALGMASVPVAVSLTITAVSGRQVTRADVIPFLLVGVLLACLFPVFARLGTKRAERTLHILSTGIDTTVGTVSGQIPWAQVAAVDVTTEYVFVSGTSGNGFAIPSRAFTSQQARDEFILRMDEARRAGGPSATI